MNILIRHFNNGKSYQFPWKPKMLADHCWIFIRDIRYLQQEKQMWEIELGV